MNLASCDIVAPNWRTKRLNQSGLRLDDPRRGHRHGAESDNALVSSIFASWRVAEISDTSWQAERYVLRSRLQQGPLGKERMRDLSAKLWQTYITSPEKVKLAPRTRKLIEQAYRAVMTYGAFMGASRKHDFLTIKGS